MRKYIQDNLGRSFYVTKEYFYERYREAYVEEPNEEEWQAFLRDFPNQVITVGQAVDAESALLLFLGSFNVIAEDEKFLYIYVDGYQYGDWDKSTGILKTDTFSGPINRDKLEDALSLLLELDLCT